MKELSTLISECIWIWSSGSCVTVTMPCRIHDQEERAATELQIREFGQTPRRLFVLPHPPRLSCHGVRGVVMEEEVRTVGATTEGLSRMDSSNSGGQSSLTSPTSVDQEWVHVEVPAECGMESLVQADTPFIAHTLSCQE